MSRRFAWLRRLSLLHLLGIAALAGFLAALCPCAPLQDREGIRAERCRAHLNRIGLALRQYHDRYGSFPPAAVLDADGKPIHSWRVVLLPFLDEQELHARYRFDEPWNGPHNKDLAKDAPRCFDCPSHRGGGKASYLAFIGMETPWGMRSDWLTRSAATNATPFVVESFASDILWTEPRDLESAASTIHVDETSQSQLRPSHVARPRWPWADTARFTHYLAASGEVLRVNEQPIAHDNERQINGND